MAKFTKILSIIIFRRFFEKFSYVIFFPKIFLKKLSLFKYYVNSKKYVLKYSYNFKFFNCNFNNLIFIQFSSKIQFLKVAIKYYKQLFSFKYNNFFFNSLSSISSSNFSFISSYFFFKHLKKIFYPIIKYIYSFLRHIKYLCIYIK